MNSNGFNTTQNGANNAPKAMKTRIDPLKIVGLVATLLFFVPAVLLSIYAILEVTEILPPRIYIGDTRIRFVGIFDNDFMIFLSVFSYLLCPFVGFAYFISRILKIKEQKEKSYQAIYTPADRLYREPEYKAPTPTAAEEIAVQPQMETVEPVIAEEAEELQEENSSEPSVEAIPDRPAAFEFAKLSSIDSTSAFVAPVDFTECFTFAELVSDFVAFLSENGVEMPVTTARRLFSAMAASRCIWISGKNRELILTAVRLLGKYFGSEIAVESICNMQYSTSDLSLKYAGAGLFRESSFIADVYKANYHQSNIAFAALAGDFKNIGKESFAPYLKSADVKGRARTATIKSPMSVYKDPLRFAVGNQLMLPSNLWYLIITDDATCEGMPDSAVAVDFGTLSAKEAVENAENTHMLVSQDAFLELIRKAKDESFISEEYWKKLDATEEYIAKNVQGFRIDNKRVRGIERYAAVCLSMQGTLYEVLDGVVAGMFIPMLASCEREALSGNEDGISVFVDRVFGMDNMPFTHEIIRKFGVD